MDGDFDPTERRIVGVLIEKALSTPDYYPMTTNALVAGCNQKNNRDPVTDYQEFQVDGALRALFEKKWVTYVEGHGRVRKWRHRLDERIGLNPQELAVIAELLLRGPQQPGELRTRAARMAAIPSHESLMQIIDELGKRLPPLIVNLGRQSGERADRYAQTLAPDVPGTTPTAHVPTPAAPAAATVPGVASVLERLDRLETEVKELRAALDELRSRPT